MTGEMELLIPGICGMGMHLKLDGFRLVYTIIAVWMWGISGAFSKQYMGHYEKKSRYYLFFLGYLSGYRGSVFVRGSVYHLYLL